MYYILSLFSALSFLVYAIGCLFSSHMLLEFNRYGFAKYRIAIGLLQLLGVTGLLIGFIIPLIGALAAGGLALHMLCAVGIRIKIGDSVLRTSPALFYLALNASLVISYLRT